MITKGQYRELTRCANFIECPLCFKCRGFNLASVKCQTCDIPRCIKETHNPKNINMMISKPEILIYEDILFKDGGPVE